MNDPHFLASYTLPLSPGKCEHCSPRIHVYYLLGGDNSVEICPDERARNIIKQSAAFPVYLEGKTLLPLKDKVTLNFPIAKP